MEEKLNINEDCMLGKGYPFYLNNNKMKNAYYYYEIVSPGLSEDLTPYISLCKVSERTNSEPWGHGSDILAMCLGNKKDIETKSVELVEDILNKEDIYVVENGLEFPLIEMKEGNDLQKALIIGLRDTLRWKLYRFGEGRKLDILWTPEEFVVFDILGDEDKIWFKPVGAYKLDDVNQEHPLDVDLDKLDYPREVFSKKTTGKISEINRTIRALEWKSFFRKNLI